MQRNNSCFTDKMKSNDENKLLVKSPKSDKNECIYICDSSDDEKEIFSAIDKKRENKEISKSENNSTNNEETDKSFADAKKDTDKIIFDEFTDLTFDQKNSIIKKSSLFLEKKPNSPVTTCMPKRNKNLKVLKFLKREDPSSSWINVRVPVTPSSKPHLVANQPISKLAHQQANCYFTISDSSNSSLMIWSNIKSNTSNPIQSSSDHEHLNQDHNKDLTQNMNSLSNNIKSYDQFKVVYPPPPYIGGLTITHQDQKCLREGEFVNDVIIDFYLKYITLNILSEIDQKRVYIFSCFFYKRLTQQLHGEARQNEEKTTCVMKRRHNRVQKWTRGIDLFSKDFIFIPIIECSHWFLAVVCFAGIKEACYVNRETNETFPACKPNLSLSNPDPPISKPSSSTHESSVSPQTDTKTCSSPNSSSPISCKKPNIEAVTFEKFKRRNRFNNCVPSKVVKTNLDDTSTAQSVYLVTPLVKVTTPPTIKNEKQFKSSFQISTTDESECWSPSKYQYREPCILVFDSLRGPSRSKQVNFIRDYLTMEWKAKRSESCGDKEFDKTSLRMNSVQVPQQDNYSDCGIFLLHYVETFFKNPIENFCVPINNLSKWFDTSECKTKRKAILEVIQNLRIEQSQNVSEQLVLGDEESFNCTFTTLEIIYLMLNRKNPRPLTTQVDSVSSTGPFV